MSDPRLRILSVNTEDRGGGAAAVALNLTRRYAARGHEARLAVGVKRTNDSRVVAIPRDTGRGVAASVLVAAAERLKQARTRGGWRLSTMLERLAEPARHRDRAAGIEDFHFPGSATVLEEFDGPPSLFHLHNLHGGYFDLRLLPRLAAAATTVLTLHDAWLVSGHCAHSLACDRWKTGCGACPDLSLYPAALADATAENWDRKRTIFAACRSPQGGGLAVATPCRWLMDKVEASVLAPAVTDMRVIANGVDQAVFKPGDRAAARATLGLGGDDRVLMFAAAGIRSSAYKDFQTLREALGRIAASLDESRARRVIMLAVGETAPAEHVGRAELRFIPYQDDPAALADCYRAADLYMHAARADTFPNTVLEALACGTPVVATAVGGIPEQVQDNETGRLTPAGDATLLAAAASALLSHEPRRAAMGERAAHTARVRFGLERQANEYLAWFEQLRAERPMRHAA